MARTPSQREHGVGRLKTRLAWAIALLAVASAVPLASNRPSWWLLWTALIALLAMVHQIATLRVVIRGPGRLRPFAYLFLLAALVPAYAVVQAQPLAGFMPAGLLAVPSGVAALAGQTISVVPDASQLGALRFAGYLILLALVIEVSSRRERVSLISRLLFLGIFLQAVWALVALKLLGDIALFGEKTAYLGMATGTFINRNSLATFLGFGLILGVSLIGRRFEGPEPRASRPRPRRIFEKLGSEGKLVLVAMLIILLALLATQSRLGVAASLIGVAVTSLLLLGYHGRLSFGLGLGIVLGGVVLIGGAVIFTGAGLSDRALFSEVDSTVRLDLYHQISGMIALRPWTGFGFDGFGPAFEAFRAPPLNGDVAFDLAHDSYLMLWSELGLVVGSIPPLLLAWAGVLLLRRLRKGDGFAANAAGAIGVLVLGALHSLGDFSLEMPANNYVLLVILGMGLALRTQTKQPFPQPTPPHPKAPA